MKQKTMHEVAKFAAGLVAADLIFLLWTASGDMLPMTVLGRTLSDHMLLPAIIFDAALLLSLIHYGWHIGKIPALRERSYLLIAGTVFGVVAVAHFMRVFFNIDLVIFTWEAPLWLSWVATSVTAYLAYMSFRLALKMKR